MHAPLTAAASALAIGLSLAAPPAHAQTATTAHEAEAHEHEHEHEHANEEDQDAVYSGYFEDEQIEERTLADWEGDWQSVYPYLADGTLDPVMEHKAEHGDMTAAEYRAYYKTGYATDVDRIVISEDTVRFEREGGVVEGRYERDGYEVLTYERGNRGVRYVFRKVDGDEDAPDFIQFSDHRIAPADSDHFHLYWGDDRAALLEELTNWPTYYPSSLDADGILHEMLAH
jgi:zinc transport system substrate-binding protein